MDDAPVPLDLRRNKAEKRAPTDVEDLIASHLVSVTVDGGRRVDEQIGVGREANYSCRDG